VGVLATLLGTRLCGLLEGPQYRLAESGVSRHERECRLAEFGHVVTQPDALDHAGLGGLNAPVGTPATDLHRSGDALDCGALLGRLDVL
jgi:hypothetical protein